MRTLEAATGEFVMVPRKELTNVLLRACSDIPIKMNTTVKEINQNSESVEVTFSDGTSDTFAVLVSCDGLNSVGRAWVDPKPQVFDVGWTVWTWWGAIDLFSPDTLLDYYGKGWLFSTYPVASQHMLAVSLPNTLVGDRRTSMSVVRPAMMEALADIGNKVDGVRLALEAAPDQVYGWEMKDAGASQWARGRIALCGDAAAAVIPTAGVGVSHAMESALVLADELTGADARTVPAALARYDQRCRLAIHKSLKRSRALGRYSSLVRMERLGCVIGSPNGIRSAISSKN